MCLLSPLQWGGRTRTKHIFQGDKRLPGGRAIFRRRCRLRFAEALGVPPGAKGVAITDVAEGSPGARAGLQAGDVILAVDRRAVTSADDATRLLGDGRAGGHLRRVHGRFGIRFVMGGRTG